MSEEVKYEGWMNEATWALALFIDNYSKEVLDGVIEAAHEASTMQRHPLLSFQIRMAKVIDHLSGCPLWRHQPIYFGEIYEHYLAKWKEKNQYELDRDEEQRREHAAVPTECELCHDIVPRGTMLYAEIAEYPDEHGNPKGHLFCRKCFEGELFRCEICGQNRLDVKTGKEYWDDEGHGYWNPGAHALTEHRPGHTAKDPQKLCEPCFNKKHHLVIVTLKF